MGSHILYHRETGEIVHIHSVYDGRSGTFVKCPKEELLASLQAVIPEPSLIESLWVEDPHSEPSLGQQLRVDPVTGRLQSEGE